MAGSSDAATVLWEETIDGGSPTRPSWWRPWPDLIAETTARDVEVKRARIVSEPLTEYSRLEYDLTFTNVIAGEQVRWLPLRRPGPTSTGCPPE